MYQSNAKTEDQVVIQMARVSILDYSPSSDTDKMREQVTQPAELLFLVHSKAFLQKLIDLYPLLLVSSKLSLKFPHLSNRDKNDNFSQYSYKAANMLVLRKVDGSVNHRII